MNKRFGLRRLTCCLAAAWATCLPLAGKAQGTIGGPLKKPSEQLATVDQTLRDMRDSREQLKKSLDLIRDKDTYLMPFAVIEPGDKIVGIEQYLNDEQRPAHVSAGYVAVKKEDLARAATMWFLLNEIHGVHPPKGIGKRLTEFIRNTIRNRQAETERAVGEIRKQMELVDRTIAAAENRRAELIVQVQRETPGSTIPPKPGRPGEFGTFSGEWQTDWGLMKLTQSGSHVSGTYEHSQGTIEGDIQGRTLRFKWFQKGNGNKGAGRFTLSADGRDFTGDWSYTDDPDKGGNRWTGTRKR